MERPKSSKTALIVGIIVAIVVVIAVIVTIVVILLLRRRSANLKASNCASNSDCPPNFLCNTTTGGCVQCLKDADCGGNSKICQGAVCLCPVPTITSATATVTQNWPPIIDVAIETSTDPSKTKFSAVFTEQGGYSTNPDFFSLPTGSTGTPTISLHLGTMCDSNYAGYGCPSDCGPNHRIKGTIKVQIENECGTKSAIKTIPISGTCDICSATTC